MTPYDPSIDPDDHIPPQKAGESPLEYMRRLAELIHTTHAKRDCRCVELGWAEQHEEAPEVRLDRIMRGGRAPGEDE